MTDKMDWISVMFYLADQEKLLVHVSFLGDAFYEINYSTRKNYIPHNDIALTFENQGLVQSFIIENVRKQFGKFLKKNGTFVRSTVTFQVGKKKILYYSEGKHIIDQLNVEI